jgi:twitching motility protein PilT
MADFHKLLEKWVDQVISQGASDLHLVGGNMPVVRVSGRLTPLLSETALTDEAMRGIISVLLPEADAEHFYETKEFDFSWSPNPSVRFRGNAYFQRSAIGVALRFIPQQIKSIAELGLPPILEDFAARRQGFFLVVGPVGQGKTTTLAAIIEKINQTRTEHIVTIEDPIEYLFQNKQSFIDQREVHIDTADFETALGSVFRQDIDVLMIGEMRTPDTIATAVTAAETGHLVFSTLHTNSAAQTIYRIIDSFSAAAQDQIRMQLSASLAGIFSQRLVPRISGGLVPVCELLINNSAVANLIREKRTQEIQTVIETSSEIGMIDMNRSLAAMVRANEITIETAYQYSWSPKTLERLL